MEIGTNTAERTSDRVFKSELDDFLSEQARTQRRAELIDQYALYLIQKGEEYYPWTFVHYEEAMGNAPEADRRVAFITVAAAVDLGLCNEHANHLALTAIRKLAEDYWKSIASEEAEKRYYNLE